MIFLKYITFNQKKELKIYLKKRKLFIVVRK